MLIVAWLLAVVVAFFALAYLNAAGWLWTAAIIAALAAVWSGHWISPLALLIIAAVLLLPAIVLNIPALRRKVVSDAVLTAFRKILPPMSQTERDASKPAPCGGTASCFPAIPVGRDCSPCRGRG